MKIKKHLKKGLIICAAWGSLLPVHAATFSWNGAAADGEWNTPGNWQGGTAANATDANVHFLSGATGETVTLGSATTLQYLTLDSGTGSFTLQGSTLTINGATPDSGTVINKSSGTTLTIKNSVLLTGATGFLANTGNIVLDGNINNNGQSIRLMADTPKSTTINGVISGSGSVATNRSGTIYINSLNTYTGSTNLWSGTIIISQDSLTTGAGAFGTSSSTITVGASGSYTPILLINGAHEIGRSLRLASGATSATIGGNSADVSKYSGTITMGSDSGAAMGTTVTAATGGRVNITGNLVRATGATGSGDTITKTGGGVVALGGTNNYSGTTTVSSGTLLINGTNSGSGAISVSSGATLGGGGSVVGAITLASGSRFSAGDLDSSFVSQSGTFTGTDFTWNSNDAASLYFDLGSTSDLLTLSGAFTKGTTGTDFVFDFSDAGGIITGTYTLVSFNSTTFSLSDFSYTSSLAGFSGNFILNANSLQFEVTSVPEPSTWLLLAAGAGLLAFLKKFPNRYQPRHKR